MTELMLTNTQLGIPVVVLFLIGYLTEKGRKAKRSNRR